MFVKVTPTTVFNGFFFKLYTNVWGIMRMCMGKLAFHLFNAHYALNLSHDA